MRTPEQIADILAFLTAAQPDNPLCLALRALLPADAEKSEWQERYEALKHNTENEAYFAKARIAELEEKLQKFTRKKPGESGRLAL